MTTRYGINSYLDWVHDEGLRVAEGVSLNLFEVETADWPRLGAKAAACHFAGSGDYCNMFAVELPAGASTTPQRMLYEQIFYVLDGHGSTQLELPGGGKRSFEWGPRSFFAIPLNVRHRHYNGSGTKRALLAATTTLPMVLNIFHNADFLFNTSYEFREREGREGYYAGEGDLHLIGPGNNIWETNFIPDLDAVELTPWDERGKGSSNILFVLADSIMHAHMSEIAPSSYKKAHRHGGGTHVLTLTGNGYSLLWGENGDFTRVDWQHGVVFPPRAGQFHQHFVTSPQASRYVATGVGNIRYPLTEAKRRTAIGERPGVRPAVSRSVKDGGDQIEYEDQDPRVHEIWLAEMRKRGITPQFELPAPSVA